MPFVRMRMGDVVWQLPINIPDYDQNQKFLNKILTKIFVV
jgi:hypothetical protein